MSPDFRHYLDRRKFGDIRYAKTKMPQATSVLFQLKIRVSNIRRLGGSPGVLDGTVASKPLI